VINIGIGGSYLGPEMAYDALRDFTDRGMKFRFVANVDGAAFTDATHDLDPAETLFILSSKTFTTLETMTNAATARKWIVDSLKSDAAVAKHFVAVSTNARAWRSSASTPPTCSASGIGSGALFHGFGHRPVDHDRVGPDGFAELLAGFHAMDEHFRTTPLEKNLPRANGTSDSVVQQLFRRPNRRHHALLGQHEALPAYLQQLQMESNGKHVDLGQSRGVADRANHLGRAGHRWPALVLPVDPSGDEADPLRLHRFLPAAEPAEGSARST
jgi:glucose-6-phosphate isomerase